MPQCQFPSQRKYYKQFYAIVVKIITEKEKSLQAALRNMLGIGPAVHLVPPKTIARSEGKAVRIIDERKLHD